MLKKSRAEPNRSSFFIPLPDLQKQKPVLSWNQLLSKCIKKACQALQNYRNYCKNFSIGDLKNPD